METLTDNNDILDEFLDQRVYTLVNSPNEKDLNLNFDYNYDFTQYVENCGNKLKSGFIKLLETKFKDSLMETGFNELVDSGFKDSLVETGFNGEKSGFSELGQMPGFNGVKSGFKDILVDSGFNREKTLGYGDRLEKTRFNELGQTPTFNDLGEKTPGFNELGQTPFNGEKTFSDASSSLNDFDFVRNEVTKLKFGNTSSNPCPPSINIPDSSYLDFSPETLNNLPYKLNLLNLPSYSRVETQIKLKLSIFPPPPELLLHIPKDLISKSKFCLPNDINLSPIILKNLLYMDAYVLTSDTSNSCNVCSRCIKREQKRASRRKTEGDLLNSNSINLDDNEKKFNSWSDENMMKKAIIFNCKEIVSFPSPSGLNNDSKNMELSARIICYCRHHRESNGFKLLFVIKNGLGQVVAKTLSSPIMIMDRKKNNSTTNNTNIIKTESEINSLVNSSTNLQALEYSSSNQRSIKREFDENDQLNHNLTDFNIPSFNNIDSNLNYTLNNEISKFNDTSFNSTNLSPNTTNDNKLTPLSPNSIDELESQTNTDNDNVRSLKRKKMSVDDSLNFSTNPMFNGTTGLSPLSNSDTSASINNPFQLHLKPQSTSFSPSTNNHQLNNLPTIQRIIPAQGPIRGGIEVTLLGFNFTPGLQVKFGVNQALATHCWSDTTIVTYLPPAVAPGQVLVSFENHDNLMLSSQQQIFTYTDDTDRQLIELALQIVGLKMNGKLEDAKNIAKRIVGTDSNGTPRSPEHSVQNAQNMASTENDWFDNAQKAVQALTKSGLATEEILINFLNLVDLPNCPIIIPNWQLCNEQGHTLLHLATIKNYSNLIKFLITHGCKIDIHDNQGLTPLFYASICGHRNLMNIFIDCKSNWNMKLSNDKFLRDYCDLNVVDVFNNLSEVELDEFQEDFGTVVSKSGSLDSLNSMFTMNYGTHVSKMVAPSSSTKTESRISHRFLPIANDNSEEYADSEFESGDDNLDFYRSDIDDCNDDENTSVTSASTLLQAPDTPNSSSSTDVEDRSIWQKVKHVFRNDEDGDNFDSLPSYDDLFPFGQSFGGKPKTVIEQSLNSETHQKSISEANDLVEDAGIASDSSEDLVVSYVNHPRKTFENDKMLLFFWFPVLVFIVGIFFMGVMGFKFTAIESFKTLIRNTLGNFMVGTERVEMVFENNLAGRIVGMIN